jgi:predicted RNA binding protein YcfA (HicA-like mRNA interferase family)
MGRLPVLKPQELAKNLRRHGFIFIRQTGSHAIYCHRDGRQTVIPMHRKTLGKGLISKILKQTKLEAEDLK